MNVLVVYDSVYENTGKIARAISGVYGENATVYKVGDAACADVRTVKLLIIGSPTQGGRPTPAIKSFIDSITAGALLGVNVAAFDTRFLARDRRFMLRTLMALIGYAADKIASGLKKKRGKLVSSPQGFFVREKEGPLLEGELERAVKWAKGLEQFAK